MTNATNTEEVLAQVDPDLHPMIREFMRKSKHTLSIEAAYMYHERRDGGELKTCYSGVRFHDNSPKQESVGGVRIDRMGGKVTYQIRTRFVLNHRFKTSDRKRSILTTDAKRAMKAMLQYITPYTLDEVFKEHEGNAAGVVNRWRTELQDDVRKLSVPQTAMMLEMQNLMRQGVKFITPEFNHVAETAMAAYEETQRRMRTPITKHFVVCGERGISVLSVDQDNGRVSRSYQTFTDMPEVLQEGVAMLRIMQKDQFVDGFGMRLGEQMFVVLEMDKQKA